jgi:hypothetical protein
MIPMDQVSSDSSSDAGVHSNDRERAVLPGVQPAVAREFLGQESYGLSLVADALPDEKNSFPDSGS